MTKFILATVETPNGAKSALGLDDGFSPLEKLQPLLSGVTCKTILENWDATFPDIRGK
jgi:hypothetical protein